MYLWSYSRDQTEEEYKLQPSTSLPLLFSFTFINLIILNSFQSSGLELVSNEGYYMAFLLQSDTKTIK